MRNRILRLALAALLGLCLAAAACDNSSKATGGAAGSSVSDTDTPPTVSGDTGGETGSNPASDSTPDQFIFQDVINAGICKVYVSVAIKVTGINTYSPISINQNGTDAQYRINGGSWRSSPSYVQNGDFVTLKMTASCASGITYSCVLTIGGVSDTWSVTTAP